MSVRGSSGSCGVRSALALTVIISAEVVAVERGEAGPTPVFPPAVVDAGIALEDRNDFLDVKQCRSDHTSIVNTLRTRSQNMNKI